MAGSHDLHSYFMEILFLCLIICGIVTALLLPSAVISYTVIFLIGVYSGRLIYAKRTRILLPYLMIISGFVLGFLIGGYYGSWKILILMFLIGGVLGYKLFEKKHLKDTQDLRK